MDGMVDENIFNTTTPSRIPALGGLNLSSLFDIIVFGRQLNIRDFYQSDDVRVEDQISGQWVGDCVENNFWLSVWDQHLKLWEGELKEKQKKKVKDYIPPDATQQG